MIEKKENGRKISNYNSKTKVVQIFMLIMTDRSRPAGKIKLKFKNFFTGNPRMFTEYSLLDSPT